MQASWENADGWEAGAERPPPAGRSLPFNSQNILAEANSAFGGAACRRTGVVCTASPFRCNQPNIHKSDSQMPYSPAHCFLDTRIRFSLTFPSNLLRSGHGLGNQMDTGTRETVHAFLL